jgi:transcription-repair coupling factor (superfamily II helicase)
LNLSGLLPLLGQAPAFGELVETLSHDRFPSQGEGRGATGLGVITPARPFVVAALQRQLGRPLLLLTTRAEHVSRWAEQLQVWAGTESIFVFPEPDALPYERVPWSRETVRDRLATLAAQVNGQQPHECGQPPVVIASARALMQKTLPVREFRLGLRVYRCGQEIDLQRVLALWVANGLSSRSRRGRTGNL